MQLIMRGHQNHFDSATNLVLILNNFQRRCKLFVYGGCKGNQNNFLSETACVRRCGDEAAIAALPDLNPQPQLQEIGRDCSSDMTF